MSVETSELQSAPEDSFRPYVPEGQKLPELTISALVLGSLLGIIFGASSLYLVLKVGMTVSASIPVAVLSITVFRGLSRAFRFRSASILQNNIVQTAGSAGESIAFGVGVTMPALMILGYDMEQPLFQILGFNVTRVLLVSVLGGLLGILMMIPLRKAFIVKQHRTLTYPEGTACAKVLIVGEQGGSSAKTVFVGFGLAFAYQVLMQALKLWQEYPAKVFNGFKGAVLTCEASPVLLGVGYIIGFRTSCIMFGGGLLAAMVLTPAITLFGGSANSPIFPGTKLISAMTPAEIHRTYVLYIGAGAVATGGIISLIQALPLIGSSLVSGLRDLGGSAGGSNGRGRTDRDLPLWLVGVGTIGLVVAIASTSLIPTDMAGRIAGAVMIVVFGFLFVTVSSRLTGEIGSSSNPISGMTVATLLLTCLIFVLLGWVAPKYSLAALSIAGIVCIAASNGGTTSQDLKTGYLLGATPRSQQISILVGALTSSVVIGFVLLLMNNAGTIYSAKAENLPTIKPDASELTESTTYDGKTYKIWRVVNPIKGNESGKRVVGEEKGTATLAQAGKYLVDDSGSAVLLVDPAINGRLAKRDDGTDVQKYEAPKAALMALIIDGIMTQKLPWALVLLGVFIAIVLQLAGVPPLAFAVGVYLPLSTSMPIFIGGLVRAAVDRIKNASQEDSDSSPAVLLSSGYIAGGAIAGILIAGVAAFEGVSKLFNVSTVLPKEWNESAWPSLVVFGSMVVVLFLVGLGVMLESGGPKAKLDVEALESDL